MSTLHLLLLESLETRYTAQWKRWIPKAFKDTGVEVVEIEGDTLSSGLSSKNFLDPNQTNMWKSEQIIKISKMFQEGVIKSGDKFLHLDAWHYGVIAIHYMSKLNNISVKQFGLWHAGSYDSFDLLGQLNLFKDFSGFESSIFNCLDKSFVATNYHKKLILSKFKKSISKDSIIVSGFPYNYDELNKYKKLEKENLILFPHRLSEEKQPNILKDLEPDLNKLGYKVIFCQEQKFSKDEYHTMLGKAKMIFSAALQETMGISTYEGMYLNVLPFVPNRLSYSEMYHKEFKYPSEWTLSFDAYKSHKQDILDCIDMKMKNYDNLMKLTKGNIRKLKKSVTRIEKIVEEVMNA